MTDPLRRHADSPPLPPRLPDRHRRHGRGVAGDRHPAQPSGRGKVLKHEYADDPQFRTRFDTEARNAAALQHPGIAGVFDYSSDPQPARSRRTS